MLETEWHTTPKTNRTCHSIHTCTLTALYELQETGKHDPLVSGNEPYLECTASGDRFVCIERGADVFAEKLCDPLFDRWDSCGSSNYLHSVDIIPTQLCSPNTQDGVDSYSTQYQRNTPSGVHLRHILDCSRTAFSGVSTLIRY